MQNVPIAVAAVRGSQLKALSVTRPEDLSLISPGLVIIPTSFGDSVPNYLMRGQSIQNEWLTADAPVTTYFDEVPIGRFQASSGDLFDLASVQVLKGPQGTLFGRNTTGGAILYTTQAPTSTFGGYADVTIGNYDTRLIEGAVNLPISDTLQIRISGNTSYHDGYTRNLNGPPLDNENNQSGRLSIAWEPTSNISNRLVLNYFSEDEAPAGFKLVAVNPSSSFAALDPTAVNIPASYTSFHETSLPNISQDYNTKVVSELGSDITQVDLGNNLTLKNIIGFVHVNLTTFNPIDGESQYELIQSLEMMHSTEWSDELQLQGSALDNHLKYTTGMFYFTEGGDDMQFVHYFVTTGNGGGGMNIRNTSEAIYAEGTYSFDQPAIDITVGGRYSFDQRSLDFAARLPDGIDNGACLINTTNQGGTIASPCLVPGSKDFEEPTYNVTVDWKPVPHWMVYASYKTSYHAGEFDVNAIYPAEEVPSGPETVDQTEIGSKLDWINDVVSGRLNVAAYYDNFLNVQKGVSVVKPNGTFQTLEENAAQENIDGVEADLLLRFGSAVDFSASYAYVNARYEKYLSPALGNLDGDAVGSVVPDVATIAATWHLPVPERYGHLDLRADAYWEAAYPTTDINYSQSTPEEIKWNNIPAYAFANLRLSWNDIMQSRWDVSLYVKNITDADYYVNSVNFWTSLGSVAYLMGPPRTFGIETKVEF